MEATEISASGWIPLDMSNTILISTSPDQMKLWEGNLIISGGTVYEPEFASLVANEDLTILWNLLQEPTMQPEPLQGDPQRIYDQIRTVAEAQFDRALTALLAESESLSHGLSLDDREISSETLYVGDDDDDDWDFWSCDEDHYDDSDDNSSDEGDENNSFD